MPTPTKGPRLGGGPAHERLLLANLATALFQHDRITTTEAKAKRLRPLAERMITFAKRGDLHARRRVMTVIRDKGVVHRLFTEIAPDMANRPGGYTRITKIGPRKGDNAPMAVIELVREPLSPKQATVREAEAATKRAATTASTPAGAGVTVATVAEPTAADPAAVPETTVAETTIDETTVDAGVVAETTQTPADPTSDEQPAADAQPEAEAGAEAPDAAVAEAAEDGVSVEEATQDKPKTDEV